MNLVLFEDAGVEQLNPITLTRPAYTVSCGGGRLIDRTKELGHATYAIVRPHLEELQQIDFGLSNPSTFQPTEDLLFVNARLVSSPEVTTFVQQMINTKSPQVVSCGNHVALARVNAGEVGATTKLSWSSISQLLNKAQKLPTRPANGTLKLLEYPHDVIRCHDELFTSNLNERIAGGTHSEIAAGVFAAAGVSLDKLVATDTRKGPIVIEKNVTLSPFVILRGPLLLGSGSIVLPHANLRGGVSLGHTTKVAGEIEACIIEPYTNKQHHGFLGHSYLGSWINLGAGTSNSDLKNTYGKINMEYRGHKADTGMQFMGTVIGDYVKSAINVGIFTGKTIGVCSTLYGAITRNVPSFVNYGMSFGQVSQVSQEVAITMQERVFARRSVPQRPCDIQLLRDVYGLTKSDRQSFDPHMPTSPLEL